MLKIIFLGTNGWYDTQTGNTVSILIQTPRYDIILDAGNGFAKIGKYISFNKPVYLFLSHYHLDHIIGFHTLNKFNFKKGLHIIGPKGLKNMLNTIVQKPYTFPFSKLPYPTKTYELLVTPLDRREIKSPLKRGDLGVCGIRNDTHKLKLEESPPHLYQCFGGRVHPIPFKYAELLHPVTTLGYRFQIDGKTITYCTDTGCCKNAISLAKNADLLIAECSYKRGQIVSQWPHLNPDDAAKLAKTANAKKLVLTHFDAAIYPTIESRKQAEMQAKETFNNTIAAVDNIETTI